MVLSRWPNSNCCIVLFRYCFGEKKWATVGHFVEIKKERFLTPENLTADDTDNTDFH
jgi:hypothetical protein